MWSQRFRMDQARSWDGGLTLGSIDVFDEQAYCGLTCPSITAFLVTIKIFGFLMAHYGTALCSLMVLCTPIDIRRLSPWKVDSQYRQNFINTHLRTWEIRLIYLSKYIFYQPIDGSFDCGIREKRLKRHIEI